MSNILLTPANFQDPDANTPPASWTGSVYQLINDYGDETQSVKKFFTAEGVETPDGDVLYFRASNTGAYATTLVVKIDGNTVHSGLIAAGQVYTFQSTSIPAGSEVEISSVIGNYSYGTTLDILPLTPPVGGGGNEPEPDEGDNTYSVKGFVSFGATTNNAPDQVAALGELSSRSVTFAKDRQIFGGAAGSSPDTSVNVTVFSSRDVVTGDVVPVPTPYAETMVEIGQWCYRQAINGTFTNDPLIFRQQILAEFALEVTDVVLGPMVSQGTMWLPEYVVFKLTQDAYEYVWGVDEELYSLPRFKLWFADAAFAAQYDEFALEFVAPIGNLDDFFLLPSQVRATVDGRSVPYLLELVQAKAAEDPYTILKSINFNYHDPNDTVSIYPTNWTFLIYGAAGDNIDAMKSQLADWILDNSTHTREEWTVLFPDIFTSTEYIITPMWTQYSVPNRTLDAGVYSPITNVNRAMAVAHVTCTGTNYNTTHIDENLAVVGCMFKSIALLAVGGPENIDGIYRFEKKWPDYMAVVTSSPDFNRMHPKTQVLVNKLYAMLQVAEEMSEFSDIPPGMTRLKRINAEGQKILYVVSSVDNVQYLVVAKNTVKQYFPSEEDTTALSLVPSDSVTLNTPTGSKRLQINFAAVGGVGPYEYSASSTDTVSGAINPTTGYLDVMFADFGSNTIDVTVTDALDDTYTGNYVVSSNANVG